MPRDEKPELTHSEALERAQKAVTDGPLAQLGITISDPEDAAMRIALSLADASSVDELLQEGGTNGWEMNEGRSVIVRQVEFAPSTKPGGLGFYAIVSAVDAKTGEGLTLTSGAVNVCIQLAKMQQKGWTEVPVALKIGQSASGNPVHRLVKGEAGAIPF